MRCRREAHTTQTAQRWRAAGGGFHNSAAAGMCRRRLSWQGAPVHPSSALPCSPHIVLPGRQVGGGAPQQLQIMGSLPHGVSPGISLSLGDDWCGQWSVARGLSRVLFSAAVGAKTPNSGGRAAPVHHCPRWLSKPKKGLGGDIRRLSTRAPVITSPHHITQVCLCHKSTKNFCQVAHISPPSAAHSYCACCRF